MDDGLVYHTRTFKKLFLIISNVFPIFRFILYFIKKFTQHIKMSLTKRKMAGLIFENREINPFKVFYKNEYLNKNIRQQSHKILSNKSENELMKEKSLNNNVDLKNLNYRNYNNNIINI